MPSDTSTGRRVLVPAHLTREQLHGLGSTASLQKLEGTAMGTVWTASILVPPGRTVADCQEAITGAFDDVIRQMSGWSESSDLSRFNRAPAGTWLELPAEFFTVLSRALEIAAATGGAYDPTVGEVVDLLGFGPSQFTAPPPLTQFQAARERLGWWRIQTDPATRRAFQPGGVRVDLSSIAKGFAVDLAAERLLAAGPGSFLIDLGGEARARGCKPDGQPWWCGIERPLTTSGQTAPPETVVALCDAALATSGSYRRSRQTDGGARHTHIVDPHTGNSDFGTLESVTVLDPSCMDADAYATALFVLGAERGFQWAESRHLAALFLWRTPDGLEEKWTPAWNHMVE